MVRYDVNEETGNPGYLGEVLGALKSAGQSGIAVSIIAAADVDGLCSAKIVSNLLRRESVRYELTIVNRQSELQERLQSLSNESESRPAVLLNCGAPIDLSLYSPRIFVFDSHRPIHHNNLKAPGVLVLDDDIDAETPEFDEDEGGSPAGSEDGLSEEEFDSSNEMATPRKKKQNRNTSFGSKRQKTDEPSSYSLHHYYRGSYYATPTALLLYQLALAAQQQTEDSLWLACVALAGYHEAGWYPSSQYFAVAHDIDTKYLPEWSRNTGKKQLRLQEELRLSLMRHQPLISAISNSFYFFGKLELNRDHGKRVLQQLLAFAGLPPVEYNQLHASMSLAARQKLKGKSFVDACRSFGLEDVTGFEFSRSTRLGDEEAPSVMVGDMTAADLASAIVASASEPILTGTAADVRKGIQTALDWCKIVSAQAKLVIDRRASKIKDGVRFIRIERSLSAAFSSTPALIRQLGVFLAGVYKNKYTSIDAHKKLPIILAVKNANRYVCVGVDCENQRNEFQARYRQAERFSGVTVEYDNLDPAVVEVGVSDFDKWAQALFGLKSSDGLEGDFDTEEEEEVGEDSGTKLVEDIPEFAMA